MAPRARHTHCAFTAVGQLLATAKLPGQCDAGLFSSSLYQWVATVTHSGQNMPFALPFRTDPLPNGFQLSLLRIDAGGRPVSVGDLRAEVEPEPGAGEDDRVLFVRFYEGEASFMDRERPPQFASERERLKAALAGLVDVPTVHRFKGQRTVCSLNPWKTLGISESTTDEKTIKRAFRKLALKHHPDVGGAEKSRQFVDIQQAYEVLIGRSRSKEVDPRGASTAAGWSFHDWYWKFVTARRQMPPPPACGSGRSAKASGAPLPPHGDGVGVLHVVRCAREFLADVRGGRLSNNIVASALQGLGARIAHAAVPATLPLRLAPDG
ncbi:hypothetical protein WJX81_008293 [Elliptochloris bilobata]|uniref:J domain-containing protein n=1 Tax=Elliptochloris bilobata TaxID=381761 RepID=A0AAW1R2G2_9CHLO